MKDSYIQIIYVVALNSVTTWVFCIYLFVLIYPQKYLFERADENNL